MGWFIYFLYGLGIYDWFFNCDFFVISKLIFFKMFLKYFKFYFYGILIKDYGLIFNNCNVVIYIFVMLVLIVR